MKSKNFPLINFYAPLRRGGSTVWAQKLSGELKTTGYKSTFTHNLLGYLSVFWAKGIVHSSSLPFPFRPPRAKYVLTIHGDFHKEQNFWQRFFPQAIKSADLVTVPSEHLKKALGLERALVIPNGIEIKAKRQNYQIISAEPSVGIMTNFHIRQKAVGVVELAKILSKLKNPPRLLVAGEGAHREEIENEVKQILPQSEFLGFIDQEKLFQKIDLYTYFSEFDTFGISVLEAMARAIPVVCNRYEGTAELFDQNTEQFVAKSSGEYEQLVDQLCSSEKLRQQAGQALFKRAQEFDWKKILPQWIKIYEDLISH